MTDSSDYDDEMLPRHDLDDGTVDTILSGGDPGRADLGMLVAFVEDARAIARRPVPDPSPSLAAILAEGVSTEKRDLLATAASNVSGPAAQASGPPKWRKKRMTIAELLGGLSVSAKAALGIGIAAAAVTGAGAAGALPGPAQHAVASTVNAVSPFTFPDHANSSADFGKSISSDATGTSDGQPGVDGQSVASVAPDNGLSVASQTPAGDHVPSSVPSTASQSDQSQNSSDSSDSSHGTSVASDTPGGSDLPNSVPGRP